MDQAVIARELARGHGYHSEVVRPYAWEQFIHGGLAKPVQDQADTWEPPLPSLVLAPVFGMLKSRWEPAGLDKPFPLDRVVACVSILFLLAALGVSCQIVMRLFDRRVATWMMVGLLLCQPLWDAARSGLAPMMVLFIMSAMLLLFVLGLERAEEDQNATVMALLIGMMGAAMVLTQWMAFWIVVGIAIAAASYLRPRVLTTVLVLAPSVLMLVGWGIRSHIVCGDYIGAQKATVLAMLSPVGDTWLLRGFGPVQAPIDLMFLVRKVAFNLAEQTSSLSSYLGSPLAVLFFVSVLHPFKRPKVAAFRWALFLAWLCALVGMCFVGLPDKGTDDRQIHLPFLPMMMAYGLAFLAVLWSRLVPQGLNWWRRHGAMAAGVFVSALPMLTSLPLEMTAGLSVNRDFAHWPPYLPGRIAKVRDFTEEKELLLSDAPWAVAWYADRYTVWFPQERSQFRQIQEIAKSLGNPIVGAIITPYSVKVNYVGEVFQNEYSDWARVVLAGPNRGLGVDLLVQSDFPFQAALPLAGQMSGEQLSAYILFVADHRRW